MSDDKDWSLKNKEERWGNYLDWHGYESKDIETLREKILEYINTFVMKNFRTLDDDAITEKSDRDALDNLLDIIRLRFGKE